MGIAGLLAAWGLIGSPPGRPDLPWHPVGAAELTDKFSGITFFARRRGGPVERTLFFAPDGTLRHVVGKDPVGESRWAIIGGQLCLGALNAAGKSECWTVYHFGRDLLLWRGPGDNWQGKISDGNGLCLAPGYEKGCA